MSLTHIHVQTQVLVLKAWFNVLVSLWVEEAVVVCQIGDLYGGVSPAAHVGSHRLGRLSHDGER